MTFELRESVFFGIIIDRVSFRELHDCEQCVVQLEGAEKIDG